MDAGLNIRIGRVDPASEQSWSWLDVFLLRVENTIRITNTAS